MRYFAVFIFTILYLYSFGQDTASEISKKWLVLKTQIQKRSEIVAGITKNKSKFQIDKNKINVLKKASDQLSNELSRVRVIDSLAISIVEARNNDLVIALQNVFLAVGLCNDFLMLKRLEYLQMQIEECENRIAAAENDYNETCRKYRKTGLLFHGKSQNELIEKKF